VEIKSGFLTVGEKYFRFIHQMYDDETARWWQRATAWPCRQFGVGQERADDGGAAGEGEAVSGDVECSGGFGSGIA